MSEYPTFNRRLTTASSHLRDIGNRFQVHSAPPAKWVNILALTLPEADHVRDELLNLHRGIRETHEDYYRRAAQLFKERYKPTQIEIASFFSRLHNISKGVDESLEDYTKRYNRAWDLAHPSRHQVTGPGPQLEEKKRAFVHGLERDIRNMLNVGGDITHYSWLELISRLEVLYGSRNQNDMLSATREQIQLQTAEAAIRSDNQHLELTRGVDRNLKEFTDGSGKKFTAASWSADPFATPTPLASTVRAVNGEDSKPAAAASTGQGRQRGRGGRGGKQQAGQKRARSPSPDAAAASPPHDGRSSEAQRENLRQAANKRPRDSQGHFKPGVKHEQGGPASGSNATPLGNRGSQRTGTDSKGNPVVIKGPCTSCGLNHVWKACRRNPNSKKHDPHLKDETGPHYIATLPGYKLGDEFGAFRDNPHFEPSTARDRVAGAGSQ